MPSDPLLWDHGPFRGQPVMRRCETCGETPVLLHDHERSVGFAQRLGEMIDALVKAGRMRTLIRLSPDVSHMLIGDCEPIYGRWGCDVTCDPALPPNSIIVDSVEVNVYLNHGYELSQPIGRLTEPLDFRLKKCSPTRSRANQDL